MSEINFLCFCLYAVGLLVGSRAAGGDWRAARCLLLGSLAGWAVGSLLVAGAVLLLTAPDGEQTEAYVAPWVGVASAGVTGRF